MKQEYQLNKTKSVITDRIATPVSEWLQEGRKLFGTNIRNWRFRCPMCGKEYSTQEYMDVSGKDDPNIAYQECIGRPLGAGAPNSPNGNPDGCNWAAYGLFGTCGKGRLVQADDGTVVEVFNFAKEQCDE